MDMEVAHEEDGHLVGVSQFDYDAVERSLFDVSPADDLTEITPLELEAAQRAFSRLLAWIWQDGMKNPDGVKIRAIILCWIFLKHLRPMTLTELAMGYGMKKQSLGRWVDQFKRDFPEYKTCHMRAKAMKG
jgi:hypothetical protein